VTRTSGRAIGEVALGWLLSHDALRDVPAVLEVPGDGKGPRLEDVRKAKKMYAAGKKRRSESRN
ncbi:MAG: hypothetical protein WB770_08225, partial [Acidimicrobiales bacterium]